ncbi:hypothetical protein HPB50_024834 [Hyalomma asiaticum]|uniref:Uncharacterized protein n=1 Tax=Hyalomma asiaticum TaxID=266040 RepID=A0ACB7T9L8_HYAAI|nr:hypothetical protein HPB50_024834 [Hyalomma asiaticum]
MRRHELIYGRLPPHNAPSPNPDTVRYAPSISNQEQEQTDKHSYSATLKRPGRQGPSTERHDQSTGNAAHCAQTSHESGRAAQQQPVPLYQQPHLTPYQRRQHSPQRHQSSQRPPQAALRQPATTAPGASASTSDYAPVPMAHVLLPMLFTALRAILSAIPQANNLPEVKALLSMESLVIPQPPSESRQASNNEQYIITNLRADIDALQKRPAVAEPKHTEPVSAPPLPAVEIMVSLDCVPGTMMKSAEAGYNGSWNTTFQVSTGSLPSTDSTEFTLPSTGHSATRLPYFWPEHPDIWSNQVEARLSASNVASQQAKYFYLLHCLTTLRSSFATSYRHR